MGQVHGRKAYWSLDGVDLSQYGDATDPERTADSHETTTYHPTRKGKTYSGGNLDGTCTVGGLYESGASNTPRVVIENQLGETVAFIYRPEGTGTGKPEKTVDVVITKYTESIPVGDMIRWSADLQFTGDVAVTTQA
jgi:hypothetical protein